MADKVYSAKKNGFKSTPKVYDLDGNLLKTGTDISKASITITPQEYTGRAIKLKKEDVKVKLNGTYLDSENFEIVDSSYKNNVKKGTASVTIRGIGEYGGSKTAKFTIKAKKFEWWKALMEQVFN